jgi:hypothetical protein
MAQTTVIEAVASPRDSTFSGKWLPREAFVTKQLNGGKCMIRKLLGSALIAAALAAPARADVVFADGAVTRFHFGCDAYFHTWLVQPIAFNTVGPTIFWRAWMEDPGGSGNWQVVTAWNFANGLSHWAHIPSNLQGRWLRFWVEYSNTNTQQQSGEFLKITQAYSGTYDGWCWF